MSVLHNHPGIFCVSLCLWFREDILPLLVLPLSPPLPHLESYGSFKVSVVQSKATVKRAVSFQAHGNKSCSPWALCEALCDLIWQGQK